MGRPPTLADSRRNGVVAFFVDCAGLYCHRRTSFTFDELGLSDDVVFIEIPRHRRFRCTRCGSEQVTVVADWPNPMEEKVRRDKAEAEARRASEA